MMTENAEESLPLLFNEIHVIIHLFRVYTCVQSIATGIEGLDYLCTKAARTNFVPLVQQLQSFDQAAAPVL